jgi:hypothetical protein
VAQAVRAHENGGIDGLVSDLLQLAGGGEEGKRRVAKVVPLFCY